MPRYFSFHDQCFTSIPVWIKLYGVPLECWDSVPLGKIVSYAGVPIASDMATKERTHSSFARVLVDVDATKPLVRKVDITMPNGKKFEQLFVYEYDQILCQKCGDFGHDVDKCNQGQTQQRAMSRSRSRARSKVWREKRGEEGPKKNRDLEAETSKSHGAEVMDLEAQDRCGGEPVCRGEEGTERLDRYGSHPDHRGGDLQSLETEASGRKDSSNDDASGGALGAASGGASELVIKDKEEITKSVGFSMEDDDLLVDDNMVAPLDEQGNVHGLNDNGKAKTGKDGDENELPRKGKAQETSPI